MESDSRARRRLWHHRLPCGRRASRRIRNLQRAQPHLAIRAWSATFANSAQKLVKHRSIKIVADRSPDRAGCIVAAYVLRERSDGQIPLLPTIWSVSPPQVGVDSG